MALAAFVLPGTGFGAGAEQMPSLFEAAELGFLAVRREQDVLLADDQGRRDDVPGVGGNDVGGDEVQLLGDVGPSAGSDTAAIGIPASGPSALDLDAEEVSAVLDREVVRGGLAPGLGDGKAEFGGAGHEAQFGPFATPLRVGDVDTRVRHGFRDKKSGPEAGRFFELLSTFTL